MPTLETLYFSGILVLERVVHLALTTAGTPECSAALAHASPPPSDVEGRLPHHHT